MKAIDEKLIRRTLEIALHARAAGNHPFGALLADAEGNILLEAENTVVTGKDVTGHAETNLMRLASARYSPATLKTCSLYTSTEPCAMCAGAVVLARLSRLVFGAPDPKAGACGSLLNLVREPRLNHLVEVTAANAEKMPRGGSGK